MERIDCTGWFEVNPNPVAFSIVGTQTQRRLGLGGFAATVSTSTISTFPSLVSLQPRSIDLRM